MKCNNVPYEGEMCSLIQQILPLSLKEGGNSSTARHLTKREREFVEFCKAAAETAQGERKYSAVVDKNRISGDTDLVKDTG